MKPLWRRLYNGDVSPGWMGRSTGRDQPETVDLPEVESVRVVTRPDGPRSLMPDRPYKPEDHWTERDRRPLLPEALGAPRDAISFAVRHACWVVSFHLVRIPVYLGRNLLWAPRGLTRLIVGLARWARVHDAREVEWSAADAAISMRDASSYATWTRLRNQRRDQVRSRTPVAVLGAGAAVVLVVLGLSRIETMVPTALVLVIGLGWSGRPMDRPYMESAVVSAPGAKKITPDMIIRALLAAKLCKETTGPDAPEFVAPGVYREGQGFGAIMDLPYGYTAEQAIDRRQKIAAGLRVDEFRLFVEQVRGDQGHAGRVRLWIADRDPHAGPATMSPLVKTSSFDLWNEVPFGTNEKGRLVSVLLVWTSVLIGALPRMGKTFALRLLLAAAALDPYVRLLLWDGKGGKDHAPFEKVCHAFGAGPDDDVCRALLVALEDLVVDMRKRYAKLRSLPDDVCPDGKLTRNLARDPRMNMPLTVVAIDEFQVYLENSAYGAKTLEALTTLAKVGPAAGIILIFATQRPSSASIKTDLRDVLGVRFAMRVTTREFSEMVLGSGSYSSGLDASKFLPSHKGVGILLGSDDGPLADKGGQTVHTHLMDLPAVTAVCDRARALREGAGTLTGVAAGEENEALSDRVLEHVAAAFQGDEQAHSDVLCARLAELHPGLYADPDTRQPSWDPTDLAAALGRYGIPAGQQIWAESLEDGVKRNRKGFRFRQVADKVLERSDGVPDSPPEDL